MTVATITTLRTTAHASAETTIEPRTRLWTREEFYKLADEGWFEGQRVLLLEGEIIQMPAMKHPHAWSASKSRDALLRVFGMDHWIRDAMPLNATVDSDPEPDVAVTERPMSYYKDHPITAILIVEISDTSLFLDRRKAVVYAEAGVKEYWILNINDRQLEVYRKPDPATKSYGEYFLIKEPESVAPQSKPTALISISELLP